MTRETAGAERRVARALSMAIEQPTVAGGDPAPFLRLHAVLRALFPRFFEAARVRTVDGGALLCCLPGQRSARPLLFLSHLDVYPVRQGEGWQHPPFEGAVTGGYVYGRGSLDMKGHLIALLTAAESLLEKNGRPQNDVWFAFSCDEEVRGTSMGHMCDILLQEGVRPAFVLDEGGAVTRLERMCVSPAALIGVEEKGHLRMTLTDPADGDAARLLRAAEKLLRMRFQAGLTPVTLDMLAALSPIMNGPRRLAAAHPRLCRSALLRDLNRTVYGRSLSQTRLAISRLSGDAHRGEAAGVTFEASVLPGDSAARMLKRMERMLARDGVLLTVEQFDEPSATSPCCGAAWDALTTAVQVHFPGVPCVPYLLTGGSDARRMERVCPFIYRFSPFSLTASDIALMHSLNEKISVENLVRGVAFFKQMLLA